MLATDRLIEIELLCAGKAHHIEVIESDGEYLKIVIFLNDGSNLRVAELWDKNKLAKYSYYWLSSNQALKIGWDKPKKKIGFTVKEKLDEYGKKAKIAAN